MLAELHAADFLRLDEAGRIRAAYPFSAVPTAHVVKIEGGPRVYAMCAIDALGMAAMLGTRIWITSADPGSGAAVTVAVPADGTGAGWDPATAVVFAGRRVERRSDSSPGCASCEEPIVAAPPAALDVCCGHVNFFATAAGAVAWARTHTQVTGRILDQADAERLAAQIFGPMLTDPN